MFSPQGAPRPVRLPHIPCLLYDRAERTADQETPTTLYDRHKVTDPLPGLTAGNRHYQLSANPS